MNSYSIVRPFQNLPNGPYWIYFLLPQNQNLRLDRGQNQREFEGDMKQLLEFHFHWLRVSKVAYFLQYPTLHCLEVRCNPFR